MGSLLETVAALGLSALVMAMVVASLAAGARLQAACILLGDELFETRQLEHLVDRATQGAGSGPGHPAPLSSLTGDTVVFAADTNGDKKVDTTSAETTALEVRQSGSTALVRIRLGRQTMTVLDTEDSVATLAFVDRRGRTADAATASLVELAITPKTAASAATRRLLFSVPARTWP